MKNIEKAKIIGEKWAESLCKDMWVNHKNYRGEKMTIDYFPTFVPKTAEAGCFMEFSYNTKNLKKLEIICGRSAYNYAKKWLKENLKNLDF